MGEHISEEVYVNLVLELPLQTLSGVPARAHAHTHTSTLMHTRKRTSKRARAHTEKERDEIVGCVVSVFLRHYLIDNISKVIFLTL